ncbi:MAG: flavodoxin [Alphaproteobacteria bacterium]
MPDFPILLVCYSRSGRTRTVAARVAERCGGRLAVIEDVRSRAGPFAYFRSAFEALKGRLPAIREPDADPAAHALVVLATPVWAGRMAAPMRSWLARHAGQIGRLAVICTQGGSGADQVVAAIEAVCGRPAEASLVATSREVDDGRYAAMADRFAARLVALAADAAD